MVKARGMPMTEGVKQGNFGECAAGRDGLLQRGVAA